VELQATGEKARGRQFHANADLTGRELQIARLAADRLSSREIASQLFISPHTVEYHLKKIFLKLGVGSRRDLAAALPSGAPTEG
jgi:DNA-binding CsgD family transcriptional regulator